MRISTPTLIAAVILAALSFGAHADTSSAGTTIRGRSVVYYGDLNIETERDAKIMLQRIERAARKACGGQPTFSTYTGSLDDTFEECRAEAIQRTVKQLGAPMVTRIYTEERSRGSSHRWPRFQACRNCGIRPFPAAFRPFDTIRPSAMPNAV